VWHRGSQTPLIQPQKFCNNNKNKTYKYRIAITQEQTKREKSLIGKLDLQILHEPRTVELTLLGPNL